MAVTSWKFPSANTQFAATTDSYTAVWANEANMYADDTSYATNNGDDNDAGPGEVVRFHGFGFTSGDIPEGATIDGIEIEVYGSGNSTTNYAEQKHELEVQLHDGTSAVGTKLEYPNAIEFGTSMTAHTVGGASDTWSAGLTQSDIVGNSGFGVLLGADGPRGVFSWSQGNTQTIDYVKVRVYYTESASNTEVNAAAEALTITTHDATVSLAVDVAAAAEALTITGHAATITHDVGVGASVETLTISTHAATIAHDVGVDASVETLTISTHAAAITLDITVAVAAGSLVLTPNGATISTEATTIVEPPTAALSLTTHAAGVAHDVGVDASAETLTISTHAATVALDIDIGASVETLTISTHAAAVTHDIGVTTTAPAGLSLATYAATVEGGVNVAPGTVSLILSPLAAAVAHDIGVSPGAVGLALTTHAAAIAHDIGVDAAAEALELATHAAAIILDVEVHVGTAGLALSPIPCALNRDINVVVDRGLLTITPKDAGVVCEEAAVFVWVDANDPCVAPLDSDGSRLVTLASTGPTGVEVDNESYMVLSGEDADAEV